MASVLLDHNVPRGVRRILAAHDVRTTREMGWDALTNGELLSAAEAAGFAVLVTADRNIRHQQNLAPRTLALVVLGTNVWPVLRGEGERIAEAVARAGPGSYAEVAIGPPTPAAPSDEGLGPVTRARPLTRSAAAPRARRARAGAGRRARAGQPRPSPAFARTCAIGRTGPGRSGRWSGGPKRTRVQARPPRA